VGSPDYMAYEILEGSGYDFSVDWWSIGIILFEMVTGVPPFFAELPNQVFANIMEYETYLAEIRISLADDGVIISDACWDLITKLICKPEDRLGKNSGSEILAHPFFKSLQLTDIQKLKPPFVPKLKEGLDLSYFDTETVSKIEEEKKKLQLIEIEEELEAIGKELDQIEKDHKKVVEEIESIDKEQLELRSQIALHYHKKKEEFSDPNTFFEEKHFVKGAARQIFCS